MSSNTHYSGLQNSGSIRACNHIVDDPNSYQLIKCFTGEGIRYFLACNNCKSKSHMDSNLFQDISDDRFEEFLNYSIDHFGQPEILRSERQIQCQITSHKLGEICDPVIYRIQMAKPIENRDAVIFALLVENAALNRIDQPRHLEMFVYNFSENHLVSKLEISDIGKIDLLKSVNFILSNNLKYLVIYNEKGRHGLLIDVETGSHILQLDRQDYHEDVSHFSLAFVVLNSKDYLIYATDWNRLDIYDLEINEMISSRGNLDYGEDHYLDYFHGTLYPSPFGSDILDFGWVWGPYGVCFMLDFENWLTNNPYKVEDSVRESLFGSEYSGIFQLLGSIGRELWYLV